MKTYMHWFTGFLIVDNIEFINTYGLKCIPKGNQPIVYLNDLFLDELFYLVKETNAYATEIFLNTTSNNEQISTWVNSNRLEMK